MMFVDSIGARLTWWYIFVLMATVSGALVLGRWMLDKELVRGIDLLNSAEMQEILNRVQYKESPITQQEFLNRVAAHAKIDAALYFFQVRRNTGEILFRSDNMRHAVFPANPQGKTNWTFTADHVGVVRIADFRVGDLDVQIASSLRNLHQLAYSYVQVGGVVLGVTLVLSIFLARWLARLALDPIRQIQQTATRISADNLSERIPVGCGEDEVADLARLLNEMFDRLEKSFQRLLRFAGSASHELKTPLAVIRLQSEKLLKGPLTSGQQEDVQHQLENINRLSTVIDKLLFLAKSEAGAIQTKLQLQSTQNVISALEEDARALCDERKVQFQIVENADALAICSAALLRQVLLNLVSNALNATPPGGSITVSSFVHASRWKVAIEDTGIGLPAEQLEKVFEPFVRVHRPEESLDSAALPGVGLGLAICRSILELHKGEIHAENRQPGPGLRVAFEIPI